MKISSKKNTERLTEYFTQVITYTKIQNKLGQYDFSKDLEIVTKDLLNNLYGLNLKLLETEKQNYPSIDLGDKKKKLAVQVTSQNTKQKIQTTLDNFKK